MSVQNGSLPNHVASGREHDSLGLLRLAVMLGVEEWHCGRLDDRPIADILDDLED